VLDPFDLAGLQVMHSTTRNKPKPPKLLPNLARENHPVQREPL
jgi:hypothetical protein